MRDAAKTAEVNGDANPVQYGEPVRGTQPVFGRAWDADQIYGCICEMGWTGYDCSLRDCNRGDDPYTRGQMHEHDRVIAVAIQRRPSH